MQRRRLGSSDLTVPVICLGTMNWGQKNAHEQLNFAIAEKGVELY